MSFTSCIREMLPSDQPRERLKHYGAKSLSNHELLAIILRTGYQGENVVQLAIRLINHFGSLYEFKHASIEELQAIKGIGPTKAIEIKAAIEFGERVHTAKLTKLGLITSTDQAGAWLMKEMGDLHQEHLRALFLNSKNEIIKQQTIFIGSVNSSIACPREIFKQAVKYPTARMIIAHNHPSGNPEPSEADKLFTKRMIACGEMMGIELLDHLIIGCGSYLSLREVTDVFYG